MAPTFVGLRLSFLWFLRSADRFYTLLIQHVVKRVTKNTGAPKPTQRHSYFHLTHGWVRDLAFGTVCASLNVCCCLFVSKCEVVPVWAVAAVAPDIFSFAVCCLLDGGVW